MLIKATTRDNKSITLPIEAKNSENPIKAFLEMADLEPENIATLEKI